MSKTPFGHLALRHEGAMWNAYWTRHQDSMDDAVLIGSIRMTTVDAGVYQGFINLMSAAFGNVVMDVTGQTPEWNPPRPAPESDRSGHA